MCSSLATTDLIRTLQGFNPGLGRERPEPLHVLKITGINLYPAKVENRVSS